MTRLITGWICDMEKEIRQYERSLKKQIGMDLTSLAAKACGMDLDRVNELKHRHTAAVVPITSGLGIIGYFPEAVASIVRAVGVSTFVTTATDVDGIYEAKKRGADLLFMADDNRYIALNLETGAVGENDRATAMGYITALESCAGSLEGADVLVVGYGAVGREMTEVLLRKKAAVTVYDKNTGKTAALKEKGISTLVDSSCMKQFKYLLDATNEGGWLHKEDLSDDVVIAAPGMPLSLDEEAFSHHRERVIHDPLQIGTAVMLGLVL